MTNINHFHVSPFEDRWQIVREGVVFAECQNKKFAITCGRKMASKYGAALVIHPSRSVSLMSHAELKSA